MNFERVTRVLEVGAQVAVPIFVVYYGNSFADAAKLKVEVDTLVEMIDCHFSQDEDKERKVKKFKGMAYRHAISKMPFANSVYQETAREWNNLNKEIDQKNNAQSSAGTSSFNKKS